MQLRRLRLIRDFWRCIVRMEFGVPDGMAARFSHTYSGICREKEIRAWLVRRVCGGLVAFFRGWDCCVSCFVFLAWTANRMSALGGWLLVFG